MFEITGLLGAPCGRWPLLQQIRDDVCDATVDSQRIEQTLDTIFGDGRKKIREIDIHYEAPVHV